MTEITSKYAFMSSLQYTKFQLIILGIRLSENSQTADNSV